MQPSYAKGWEEFDTVFVAEDRTEEDHTVEKKFSVPHDATGLAVLILPVEEETPITLDIKEMNIDVTDPLSLYTCESASNS